MSNITTYEKKAIALFSKEDIESLKQFEELKVKVSMIEKANHEKLAKLFKDAGVKSFEGNGIRITYVEPHERRTVDTERLKAEGLYDEYSKVTKTKESIRVSIEYEN